MNYWVDFIVAMVLVIPMIYGAVRYSGRLTGTTADQIVDDLSDRSRRDAEPKAR